MTATAKHDIEARRLALQASLDGEKTSAERNRMGQFPTPTTLAREILAASLQMLPKEAMVRFLDPAIGTGSFYSALLATSKGHRVADATGFEIDPHYGTPAAALWADTPLRLVMHDFTTATPPVAAQRANLLVCNPPYVRHHHLTKDGKVRLQNASERASGVRIKGLAGLYAYFMALAHPWMAEDGVAAWLIPSEFMDVNYGRAVKAYLLNKVQLLRIHRFDPNDVQFDDALVSSAIVWFKKALPNRPHSVEFTFGGSLMTPRVQRLLSTDALAKEAKWSRYPVQGERQLNSGVKLKDFFNIKRGLVTGNNKFFFMTAAEATARNIPQRFLTPILPSPRYLPDDEIAAGPDGVPLIERQIFLLDCNLPEAEVKANHPGLWAYLQSAPPKVYEAFLCSKRSPWYRQEIREPSPFICTYMGRSDGKDGAPPFRFILNHSKAKVANVYLNLYPKPILAQAIEQQPALARQVWEVLQAIRPQHLIDEGRVYGGGLHKMEPKELANVSAATIAALMPGPGAGQVDFTEQITAAEG